MRMFCNPQRTFSICLWKLAGHPSSPKGEVIQWNCPLLGMVKAVVILVPVSSARIPKLDLVLWKWMCWLCRCPWCIYWSPSWSTCQCGSAGWVAGSPEQSWVLEGQGFLVIQNIGELYGELDWQTTPSFSHSSRLCSMNWVCASGKLNCFRKMGCSSLRCIWCMKSFAKPRSYLPMIIAAWCLNKVLMYRLRYGSGAPRWHWSSISFLVHVLFLTFGSRWWICSQMVARLLLLNGIGVSV